MRLPSDDGSCLEDVELDGASTRHRPIEAKAAARGGLWCWWPVGVLLIAAAAGQHLAARAPTLEMATIAPLIFLLVAGRKELHQDGVLTV